jgi:hypothetical protein
MGSGTYQWAEARIDARIGKYRRSILASACHCVQLIPTPKLPLGGDVKRSKSSHWDDLPGSCHVSRPESRRLPAWYHNKGFQYFDQGTGSSEHVSFAGFPF